MNYERVYSFAVFAKHLNFTHAAVELCISQPALHVQIRKLSEEIGVALYRRTGRSLHLTTQGQQLANFGTSIQRQGDEILRKLRGETFSGPVVLAAGQGAFLYLLGPAIRKFPKSKWPLRLLTAAGVDAVAAMLDGTAHVAVTVLPQGTELPSALSSRVLSDVHQIAVMPKNHKLACRQRLSPTQLSREPLVVAPIGQPHRTMVEQAFNAHGASLHVAVEAQGWELMMEFSRSGIGIAIVNDFCNIPKGCVAVSMTGMPSVSYSLIERRQDYTPHESVAKLVQLITR